MLDPFTRDLGVEREVTHRAGARANADSDALNQHAEFRSLHLAGEYTANPMIVAPDRDMARDVREEVADARNYMVWWLLHQSSDSDPETVLARTDALGLICAAYQAWRD